eukprot:gnl/Hemi2/11587_TR3998_c0_g4_i1.p1 gnl/Hemi2/11587_TR3998_c0_g4~~gnl/Hemi2/11587_TR3998_c0_g4_i1.p1  ORF type:complete len:178 (-),score=23.46 gnl/Hemi2/11587_TR3998_c0_g4_i1:60-593(-)
MCAASSCLSAMPSLKDWQEQQRLKSALKPDWLSTYGVPLVRFEGFVRAPKTAPEKMAAFLDKLLRTLKTESFLLVMCRRQEPAIVKLWPGAHLLSSPTVSRLRNQFTFLAETATIVEEQLLRAAHVTGQCFHLMPDEVLVVDARMPLAVPCSEQMVAIRWIRRAPMTVTPIPEHLKA